ncbi:hypothetical protein EG834_11560, partial [bacterium]|nr:hypothetical protein [bacterium]
LYLCARGEKILKKLALIIGALLLAILAACSSNTSRQTASPSTEEQTGQAEITSVELLPGEAGGKQQRILVQGKLPGSCAVLGEINSEQLDLVFTISATYTQTSTSNCSSTPLEFDKVFTLDISQLSPGVYTVQGGAVSVPFTISDTVAAANPTPTPDTPQPQPTESVLPSVPTPATPAAEVPAAPGVVPVTSECTNKVAFYADVTIPDGTVFKQGEAFTKTWSIRNEGTCTITPGYTLVFAAGDPLDGPLTSPMPEIAPGQIANLSVNLAAPKQGGKYGANYEFRDPNGNRFGVNSNGIDYIWVEIVVDWGNNQASSTTAGSGTTASGSGSVPVSTPANCVFTENPGYLDTILNLVNAARTAEGLAPFTANPALMAAAKVHSLDMGCNNFLDHTGSDGSKARNRIIAQGYNPSYAAENIYAGATEYGADAQGAFDWWMNSPVHRKNILNARPTE